MRDAHGRKPDLMPSYDYECRICGHRLEVLHGVNDSGPTACVVCGGPMRKLLSTPNIVFKGKGWAKKDARDARPAARSTASAGKSESTESSTSSSGESSGDSSAKGDSTAKGDSSAKSTEGSAGSTATEGSSAGGTSTD